MNESGVLTSAVPALFAQDVAQAIEFYREKLGFTLDFQHGEPISFAGVARDAVRIYLSHCEDRHLAENTMCWIFVENIEALAEEFLRRGAPGKLETQPWGLREFVVIDPAGNCVHFAEAAAPAA